MYDVHLLYPLQRNGHGHAYVHSLTFLSLSGSLTFLYMCNVSTFWLAFVYLSDEELFYLDANIEIYWMAGPSFIELRLALVFFIRSTDSLSWINT